MYDLNQFTLRNMSECGLALRQLGTQAESMEVVGKEIIHYLYEHFVDQQSNKKSCSLIRLFKTHSYNDLTPDLKAKVHQQLGHSNISPSLKCLTLLATAGEQPEWNSRHQSKGHQVIPLTDEIAIANIPMVAQLIHQLGIDPGAILQSGSSFPIDSEQRWHNVFLVPDAMGSPYIPSQNEFVKPFKIKSVVGFGGLLPSGNMFAVLMFLKVTVSRDTLDLIRPLALSVKAALLPFDDGKVFADGQPANSNGNAVPAIDSDRTVEQLRSQVATLTQLLTVSEQATLRQSDQLEQAITDLKRALKQLKKTQTQMVHGEKMSSLGQMVAGISHEINNPVNFIFGNITHATEYIQELFDLLELYRRHYPQPLPAIQAKIDEMDLDFFTSDLTKLLSSMKMGAERIREIVRSLRIFSCLDEAEFKPANVHEGLNSTLLLLQHRLRAKSDRAEIQVVKEYGDIPYIDCYPGQLNQVFINILSNAIDALDDLPSVQPEEPNTRQSDQVKAGRISIHTSLLSKDWIRICIADNGAGMSDATRAKLFDPFFTTKPVGKGTGLGLSISYQIIVDKHGGKLTCRSAPGQGAEFIIDLPIWKQVAIANEPTTTVTSPDLVSC